MAQVLTTSSLDRVLDSLADAEKEVLQLSCLLFLKGNGWCDFRDRRGGLSMAGSGYRRATKNEGTGGFGIVFRDVGTEQSSRCRQNRIPEGTVDRLQVANPLWVSGLHKAYGFRTGVQDIAKAECDLERMQFDIRMDEQLSMFGQLKEKGK